MGTPVAKYIRDRATGLIDNFNGDYSSTEMIAAIGPEPGFFYAIREIVIVIEDTGPMDSGAYGNNIALTVGIDSGIMINGTKVLSFTDGINIKTNGGYAGLAGTLTISKFGSGNEYVKYQHVLPKPVILDGNLIQEIYLSLNDDFTGLASHRFYVTSGNYENDVHNRTVLKERYFYNALTS